MRIAVLLSSGFHPVSGARVVAGTEAQAIRLAASLGEVYGVHAGPSTEAVSDALGQGLALVEHLATPAEADPVPALVARLRAAPPDLVLTGRRSQGGEETGLVPYLVAHALSMTIVADVVSVREGEGAGTLSVDQSLGRGALRRLVVRRPAVLTVHPDAPAALPFAFGRARRGRIETLRAAPETAAAGADRAPPEERPYRRRPKILARASTGAAGCGRLLIDPAPDEAAREILSYLREVGVLASAAPRRHDEPRPGAEGSRDAP